MGLSHTQTGKVLSKRLQRGCSTPLTNPPNFEQGIPAQAKGCSSATPFEIPAARGHPLSPKGRTRLRRFHASRHPVLNGGWPDVHVRPKERRVRTLPFVRKGIDHIYLLLCAQIGVPVHQSVYFHCSDGGYNPSVNSGGFGGGRPHGLDSKDGSAAESRNHWIGKGGSWKSRESSP